MTQDLQALDEVIVVGYGTQRKATLTGAVSQIRGEDLTKTANENTQNMLTGRIAGVRVTQKTAEPGSFNNNFDIRGMGTPLIIIDDLPRSIGVLQRLNPHDIESISVLKDATAAIYGVRAANGVVLVKTKRGSIDGVETSYSGSYTIQMPSGLPETLDAIDYMTLRNENSMHNLSGGSLIFGEDEFNAYRTGQKKSTDWYPLVFSNAANQTQHNVSIDGGYKGKVNYHVGLGYFFQDSFFKTNDLNYHKYNILSNVSAEITKGLTFDLSLSTTIDRTNRPYTDAWWIIRGFWRQGPHIPAYADPEETMLYHGLIEGENPLAFIDSDVVGYREYDYRNTQSIGTLKYKIPFVDGLTVKATLGYEYSNWQGNEVKTAYDQYRYDEASETYTKYTRQSPSSVRRNTNDQSVLTTQTSLNYDHKFNDVHKVNGVLVWETRESKGDNFYAQRNLGLPIDYLFAGVSKDQIGSMSANAGDLFENSSMALAGKASYTFADKYMIDFIFRYDGSSKFGPGHQWGFFPAAALAWRISEEGFFKRFAPNIEQLKLRASYGKTGDDAAADYQFISGYSYPTPSSSNRNFTGGYTFGGDYVSSASNKGIPNPNITWYTSKTYNLGIDFEAWKGKLGVTLEYFSRKREGLLAARAGGIPTVVGAALPQENLNSDKTFGLELEISHRNLVGDFFYRVKGIGAITRVKRLYVERGALGNSWDNWNNNQNNRLQGVHKGLEGNGQFTSWEEIWNYPIYTGRSTIIGDYKYVDWNGDGEINGNDAHPIHFNQYPWMNFSFIFDAAYKGFDLNILLQGSALGSLIYGEQLRQPLWGSGDASAMEQFLDRWRPEDPTADPYDPRITWIPGHYAYTGSLPDVNSSFNTVNGAYLRLKNIELGYTLPVSKNINQLRFFISAYNLLTFTKVKDVDPEHPNDTYGYLYPINRSVSFGLNFSF